MLDSERNLVIDAEIQKRLTKAVPFLRGKLTQNLGLRYAPEIRFYRDNSLDIFD
jgi:ribosome-binding factor A